MAAERKTMRICREALDFQPDAVAVGEGRPPLEARLAVYLLLAALVCAGTWAWHARLDQVVTAPGGLVTLAPPILVQPLETSVIRAIYAAPGDVVKKGAALAALDPTFAEADLGRLTEREKRLRAWIAMLQAEQRGEAPETFAAQMNAADPEEMARIELFSRRREEYRANVEAKDTEIASIADMIAANGKERERLEGQFALAAEIEGMYKQLLDGAKTSRLEYIGALREKMRVEDQYAKAAERGAQLQEALSRARAERRAFIGGWRTDASNRLIESLQELAEVEHALAKAARRNELVELRAVSDAIVKDVGAYSEGAVIEQARTLFTLAPVDEKGGALEAEAVIANKDIGHVRQGAPVRIKLAAYPFQKHGFLTGEVRMISPDAFVREDGASGPSGLGQGLFYKCRIRLTGTSLADVGPDFRLLPGMSFEAEILSGKRSVAEYLLEPILRGLHESLSEP